MATSRDAQVFDFTLVRGSTFEFCFDWTDENDAVVDLRDYDWFMDISKGPGETAVLSLNSTDATPAIVVEPTAGTEATVTIATPANFPFEPHEYDIIGRHTGTGNVTEPLVKGTITTSGKITQVP